jgi:LysR family transcriptional regulator, glycine cleavage system transcriptional activator
MRALKRGEIPSIGGLTSFVVAAQHGNFTRAADELNLTQGAISRQIRELETHLGIRLFERIRQRVVLTDAGKMYLAQVKKALDELADATLRVATFSNSTTLNLVALPTFAARWLVPRLPNFQKANPKIMVHITARQAPIDSPLEPFDAAVFHGASHWPNTISQYLMDENIVAVCSPKLNARRTIKTPADVIKFPLLHKMGKPNRWAEWLAGVGIPQDGLLQGHAYQNYAMVAPAAVAGLGIALLPHYLVEDDIAAKRLEIVGHDLFDFTTSYYLILPETRASASAVQAFAKWLTAEARIFHLRGGRRAARKTPAERSHDGAADLTKIPIDAGDTVRPLSTA